jgi:hypothetical protein
LTSATNNVKKAVSDLTPRRLFLKADLPFTKVREAKFHVAHTWLERDIGDSRKKATGDRQ